MMVLIWVSALNLESVDSDKPAQKMNYTKVWRDRSLRRRREKLNATSPRVNHSKIDNIVYFLFNLCIILCYASKASEELTFILKQIKYHSFECFCCHCK